LFEGGPGWREAALELPEALGRGDSWMGELAYRARDGSLRWVAATVTPVHPGTHPRTRYVCICTDITEAKRRELSERCQHQEQQRRSDEQYAHAASHDLQEPLRAIVSCGQMLEQDFGGSVDPTAKQLIAHMVEGGKRMQRLVLDLLDYARSGTQNPRLVCASSEDALARALAQLQTSIVESGAEIDAQGLPPVLADPQQLVELFHHLSSNALAYRGAERPLIRVRAARDGAFWRFSLSDNGIGINPDAHRRIFSLFQRLDARHTAANRGLGLPLCKKIVERHGGRIWVESERGRGATFFFTLPALASAETLE
jgi:light-regulated signal transduction histidine kinase (bacteriophytochrome)